MAIKRSRNIFNTSDDKPFKLSRSKLENFLKCARCFYIDRRLGIGEPSGPPFKLNSLVDALLKKEFDVHRAKGDKHPLMHEYGIDAVPFAHDNMNEWRENFKGVQYLHEPTNLIITGAVDDVWINSAGELIVVDYKATSKAGEVEFDDAPWYNQYRRQMEIYQWLLRKNGFKVSDTGYFVSCNGNTDKEAFDGRIEFKTKLIEHVGDDSWVEQAIHDAHTCLMSDTTPAPSGSCDFCQYNEAIRAIAV